MSRWLKKKGKKKKSLNRLHIKLLGFGDILTHIVD